MLTATARLSLTSIDHNDHQQPILTLALTAEERTRSRYRFELSDGEPILLRLPRGTVLKHGVYLQPDTETIIQILAKPEPTLTAIAANALLLLRAAYHLGNRHVPVEITPDYLRLAPDPVLAEMLRHLGLEVQSAIAPFQPEAGAYHSHT
ncbi:MAG: urease accessory protein UreE [Microcystaceae cyanobacterium]